MIGTVAPLSQLIPWLIQHGLDLPLLYQQTLGSKLAAVAWLDVIVAAIVVLIFIGWEGRRLNMRRLWIPALGTCSIGVSLGLPLFLMLRELKLEETS